jgi:signal transduction histidine kinase
MKKRAPAKISADEFNTLSRRILRYANRGLPRVEFLNETSRMLLEYAKCDSVDIWTKERRKYFRCTAVKTQKKSTSTEILSSDLTGNGDIPERVITSELDRLCTDLISGKIDPDLPFTTQNGIFHSADLHEYPQSGKAEGQSGQLYNICDPGGARSLLLIPFVIDDEHNGLLQMASRKPDYFSDATIASFKNLAQTLGIAVADRRAQAALRERVKELTCLYGIAKIVEKPDISLAEILQAIVELLPPAWLYPEITSARIILDGTVYSTADSQFERYKQKADIVVGGKCRGIIEVAYCEERLELDEGPFLREERHLIDTVARQVALIVERKETEREKTGLQEQLRHADRLATIGQLAAGVAHELNEPLGSILGFAQLATKCPGLPRQAEQDIDKIVSSSLYAREIIRKLLIFSRQSPSKKVLVNLNQIVEEGKHFLKAQCGSAGITIDLSLFPDLPDIFADPAQLNQVLVNLGVNAIQAMPEGGKLKIQTRELADSIMLAIEDTGAGMDAETIKQIFVPFFTTKDVDQGTGLGLSVTHGIVTAHDGKIEVKSKKGHGTRFEIRFPQAESVREAEDD